jgi:2'-5' RNA ligase
VRLFVAVTPGVDVLRRIEHTLDAVRPKAPAAKWVKLDNLHLTLAFLGERSPEDAAAMGEALVAVAAARAPFDLRFCGAGSFGRPSRPRVLWVGCEGDTSALNALCAEVSAALSPLGYVPESSELNAHLTLARSRDTGGEPALSRCLESLRTEDFGVTRVQEVNLYESRLTAGGPSYEPLARARLSGVTTAQP